MRWLLQGLVGLVGGAAVALAGCGGSASTGGAGGSTTGGSTTSGSTTSGSTTGGGGDAQTPPQGAAKLQAWLAEGSYKSWKCEPSTHASRAPSPHGFDRVCSNMIIETNAGGTGAWPEGAAAVKELHSSLSGPIVGYAVYLKTAADSADGASWYWYEQVPSDSPAPHDANGIVADGLGASGPAMTLCVACHSLAGSSAAETPSPGGRDFVFTPVH